MKDVAHDRMIPRARDERISSNLIGYCYYKWRNEWHIVEMILLKCAFKHMWFRNYSNEKTCSITMTCSFFWIINEAFNFKTCWNLPFLLKVGIVTKVRKVRVALRQPYGFFDVSDHVRGNFRLRHLVII